MRYLDRRDGGRRLAVELQHIAAQRPVVVALPRGGVPVAFEVARALHASLDILAVGKLGAPHNPELGVGAIAEDGTIVLGRKSTGALGITQARVTVGLARESLELNRRVKLYRDGRPALAVAGRTVLLVDDGLATGLTCLAAVRALRKQRAASIVVAVPIGSSEAVTMLAREADRIVCVEVLACLGAVGRHYTDFAAVPDEQVMELLALANSAERAGGARERVSAPPAAREDVEANVVRSLYGDPSRRHRAHATRGQASSGRSGERVTR